MNISRFVLPNIDRHSQTSSNVRKGLTSSQGAFRTRPIKLKQIITILQSLRAKCYQIDHPVKMLKLIASKFYNYQKTQDEMIKLITRAVNAEEKINQLKTKLKKLQEKYNKDLSSLVKLKLLSQSTSLSKSDLLLQCNHIQIVNKINNLTQKQLTTFHLTQAQNKAPKSQIDGKQNGKSNIDSHHSKSKLIDLEPLQGQQTLATIFNKPYSKRLNHPRHMSEVFSITKFQPVPINTQIIEQTHHLQQLEFMANQNQRLKQAYQCYRDECLRREQQQVIIYKMLLQKELQ